MLFHSSSVGDLRKTRVHWQPACGLLRSAPGLWFLGGLSLGNTHYFRTRHLGMFYILGMAHRKLTLSSPFSLALGTLALNSSWR